MLCRRFHKRLQEDSHARHTCDAAVCDHRDGRVDACQSCQLVFVSSSLGFEHRTTLANDVTSVSNLRGPSVTTDTACSSSMAALHLACETIRSSSNKTRCALVGGTSLILAPDDSCGLNALGFLSPDSRCHSFDSRANGYARGDGLCVLVVKHIDDAIRDGDPIRAVIRATGLNQDGKVRPITSTH